MAQEFIANRYAVIRGSHRQGGQGDVFKAVDLNSGGQEVAVKVRYDGRIWAVAAANKPTLPERKATFNP